MTIKLSFSDAAIRLTIYCAIQYWTRGIGRLKLARTQPKFCLLALAVDGFGEIHHSREGMRGLLGTLDKLLENLSTSKRIHKLSTKYTL